MRKICQYLKDEQGIETLEWIAIGVLILGVAFAVYPGSLQTGLTTVVGNVTTALTGVTLSGPVTEKKRFRRHGGSSTSPHGKGRFAC